MPTLGSRFEQLNLPQGYHYGQAERLTPRTIKH
jgi:hypothetical protein